MKKLMVVFVLLSLCGSCKKAIEKKQEQILMNAITDGSWIVEQYFEGSANISAEFLNYEFKFNSDGTVQSTYGAAKEMGTWSGSIADQTITSNFPSAGDTLKKINGVWKWLDSDWDYVKAEKTVGVDKNTLHLRKKQ
jgi:hypothetical protein